LALVYVSEKLTHGYYALKKCHRRDLNLRPTDPEADTLTIRPLRLNSTYRRWQTRNSTYILVKLVSHWPTYVARQLQNTHRPILCRTTSRPFLMSHWPIINKAIDQSKRCIVNIGRFSKLESAKKNRCVLFGQPSKLYKTCRWIKII